MFIAQAQKESGPRLPCTHILSSECFAMSLIGTSISSCTSDVVDSTADTTSDLERVVLKRLAD